MIGRRNALRLGLVASAVALSGRGTARAADALTIGPNGVNIDNLQVAKSLTVSGPTKIDGKNTLEFGAGIGGKQVDAGKIGYQTFTTDALDIVGAGTAGANRKVKFWAEGGATLAGSLTVEGDATLQQSLTVSGDATLRKSLTVSGPMKIDGQNALEFGAGVSGKEVSAGQIAYQKHSTDALDIVGAGTTSGSRKIKCWAEGGATLYGNLSVSGNVSIANNLYVPGGVESLRMLRGVINADGTMNVGAGAGFTVSKPGGQLYDIEFTPAFLTAPAATVSQIFPTINPNPGGAAGGGSTAGGDFANIAYLSPDRMRVKTWPNDRAFSFIVIGPR